MLQPLLRRTWAPRGQTPEINAWDRHDRLSAVAALTLTPCRRRIGLYFELLDHNACAEDFFWFIVRLHREVKRDLVVVWDRLGAHRKAARILTRLDCNWVHFEYLPAYCPELNPVEHVWNTTKWGTLANWPAPDIQAVTDRVHADFEDQAATQEVLRGHFAWAGLDLD